MSDGITDTANDYYNNKETQEWMNAPLGKPEPENEGRHETEVKLPPIDEEKCKNIFKEIGDYVWKTTLEDSELYQRLKMRHKPTTKDGAFFWYGFHQKIYLAALKLYIEQELQKPFEDEKQFEKELIEFMRRSV